MNSPSRIKAWIEREPWMDRYSLYLGIPDAVGDHHATGFEPSLSGSSTVIRYEKRDEGTRIEPLLTFTPAEYEAISRAFLADERPEDATRDALKDARTVRDRLLGMMEARGIR